MGFGGPLGGFISDRYGWRAAFMIQLPLFFVSFALTGYNLRYVTPVSGAVGVEFVRLTGAQGKGKTPREVIRRIDYGGIVTTLVWVRESLGFLPGHHNNCPRFLPLYYF